MIIIYCCHGHANLAANGGWAKIMPFLPLNLPLTEYPLISLFFYPKPFNDRIYTITEIKKKNFFYGGKTTTHIFSAYAQQCTLYKAAKIDGLIIKDLCAPQ